jgi:hypothetical protein
MRSMPPGPTYCAGRSGGRGIPEEDTSRIRRDFSNAPCRDWEFLRGGACLIRAAG